MLYCAVQCYRMLSCAVCRTSRIQADRRICRAFVSHRSGWVVGEVGIAIRYRTAVRYCTGIQEANSKHRNNALVAPFPAVVGRSICYTFWCASHQGTRVPYDVVHRICGGQVSV